MYYFYVFKHFLALSHDKRRWRVHGLACPRAEIHWATRGLMVGSGTNSSHPTRFGTRTLGSLQQTMPGYGNRLVFKLLRGHLIMLLSTHLDRKHSVPFLVTKCAAFCRHLEVFRALSLRDVIAPIHGPHAADVVVDVPVGLACVQ